MHIYAFGSVCRGEITKDSDVDLLLITDEAQPNVDQRKFSIYSYARIEKLWNDGSPFAWHLHKESVLIYACNEQNYLMQLKQPGKYLDGYIDCLKFYGIFLRAKEALEKPCASVVFEFANIFLAIRNFASCYALYKDGCCIFARDSALLLGKNSIPIPIAPFDTLMQSRILSTRGIGDMPSEKKIFEVMTQMSAIDAWFKGLLNNWN